MREKPIFSQESLYVVDWNLNFINWLAWRQWWHEALGKNFFPQKLTTEFEMPPTTHAAASMCASRINEIRKEAKIAKTVPITPEPWTSWPQAECERLIREESMRRQREGSSFSHIPNYRFNPVGKSMILPMKPCVPIRKRGLERMGASDG